MKRKHVKYIDYVLYQSVGRNLRDFFLNLDNLHDYLKFAFPRYNLLVKISKKGDYSLDLSIKFKFEQKYPSVIDNFN